MSPSVVGAKRWVDFFKDILLIFLGFYIVLHETMNVGLPSVFLLAIASACLGIPFGEWLRRLRKESDASNTD